MFDKKLVTIACALAILAIGACFLPPARMPPPPLPPYLAHIHTISIQVLDDSRLETGGLAGLSRGVADNFNHLWKNYSLRATYALPANGVDAVLRITLLHKSISCANDKSPEQFCTLRIISSSTLTALDGRILWQSPKQNTEFGCRFQDGMPPDAWKEQKVIKDMPYWLVWMLKRCPQHGHARVLIADDVDYYRRSREVFIKTPEQPMVYNTPVKYGCPYDCGLCPDHEQHSCLTLVEICDACNLTCPICYAGSGQNRTEYRTLGQIEAMLDCVVRNEKLPDVVQISGGEPTLHPDFFRVLEMCKQRPIRHLMVNTNGIRIAQDAEFAKRLASFMPQFEIYLQFDSLRREPLMQLRGADLRAIREKALERLNEFGISTTLVVTVERGVNDGELGTIIDFALQQPAVRGVTIQPVQQAGRVQGFQSADHRLTLTEVRRRILEQTNVFRPEDLIPVPCHPDALAMAYALKIGSKTVPLTGMIPPDVLIGGARNTIVYEQESGLRDHLFKLFATNHSPASQASTLRDLLCCLPKVLIPKDLGYKNLFRVLIVQFIDAEAFDVRSVKKSCIHIAHPDGKRLIPFDTFNMFYRGDLESTRLAGLRLLEGEA